jgi:5-aminopentanamidase
MQEHPSAPHARSRLRAAAVQFEPRPDDKPFNLARIRAFVEKACEQRVQLVAFPEMCLLGYWHLRNYSRDDLVGLAEPVDGSSVTAVSALARTWGLGIGVGFLEISENGELYNSYAVCLPDGGVQCHRKLHAFEHEAISSGDRFTVFDTPWGVRVGVLICWDNNLVENVRATTLLGAEAILAPHQTGGTASRSPHGMRPIPLEIWDARQREPDAIRSAIRGPSGRGWLMRWLPSRAHDNGVFVIFSNGIGRDDDEVRTGNSMIVDPYGRILTETDAAADDMVVGDLDLELLPLSTGRRWIKGRRPELYGVLTQRFGDERDPRTARFSTEPAYAPPPEAHRVPTTQPSSNGEDR